MINIDLKQTKFSVIKLLLFYSPGVIRRVCPRKQDVLNATQEVGGAGIWGKWVQEKKKGCLYTEKFLYARRKKAKVTKQILLSARSEAACLLSSLGVIQSCSLLAAESK